MDSLAPLLRWFQDLWAEAVQVWLQGGWAMIAIAVVALVMFWVGTRIWLGLRGKGFESVPEETWRRWIDRPAEREGHVGELLDLVTGARTIQDATAAFDELRTTETAPFERDLKVMKVCVSAAPLVGLLGTVTGMLLTFGALSSGSGGEKTMAMVAKGISEALITTETGLVVALPGLFFQYQLARQHDRYRVFLAHLESVVTQSLHRRSIRAQRESVREAARRQLAERLRTRLTAARANT